MPSQIKAVRSEGRRAPAKAKLRARNDVAMDIVIRALIAHGGALTLRELVREVVDERNDASPARLTRRELTRALRHLEPLGLRDSARARPRMERGLRSAA